MSIKLEKVGVCYRHYCPGCKSHHDFWVDEAHPKTGARWSFDGDFDHPTFTGYGGRSGSMSISYETPNGPHRCHYFLQGGMIQFLPDCTHLLRGVTLRLPDYD